MGRISGLRESEEECELWVTGGRKESKEKKEQTCGHKEVYMVSDMMPGACAARTVFQSQGSERCVNAHFSGLTSSEGFNSPKSLHLLLFLIFLADGFRLVVVKTGLLLNKTE